MRSSRSKRELADRLATWILVIVSFAALGITVYSWLGLIKSFGWKGLQFHYLGLSVADYFFADRDCYWFGTIWSS